MMKLVDLWVALHNVLGRYSLALSCCCFECDACDGPISCCRSTRIARCPDSDAHTGGLFCGTALGKDGRAREKHYGRGLFGFFRFAVLEYEYPQCLVVSGVQVCALIKRGQSATDLTNETTAHRTPDIHTPNPPQAPCPVLPCSVVEPRRSYKSTEDLGVQFTHARSARRTRARSRTHSKYSRENHRELSRRARPPLQSCWWAAHSAAPRAESSIICRLRPADAAMRSRFWKANMCLVHLM